MADHSMKFFSKMLDLKHVNAFEQYGINEKKFETQGEIDVFNFIQDHIKRNGETPTPEEVSARCKEFIYIPTNSSFDSLVEKINDQFAKVELLRIIQGKANNDDLHGKDENLSFLLNSKSGFELLDFITEHAEKLKASIMNVNKVGLSIKTDTEWFKNEYLTREEGRSFKVWPSRFPSINKILGGGFASGNMYVYYGRSGRGKSIFALEEAIEAAMAGATVIYYALEMPYYEVYARAYSSISARFGMCNANIPGIDYAVGFPQKEIVMAKMNRKFKERFFQFIDSLNEILPGNIIFKAVDDRTWFDKSLRQIESDIIQAKADFVVIDPAYLLDMERNTSKTAGGDLAKTSIKMRLMAGRLGIVLLTITQAAETNEDENEETGQRELAVPKRKDLAKSKQLPQDASMSFAIDTAGSRGMVVPRKGRSGGEDIKIEVTFLPNYGIVKELPKAEDAKGHFSENPLAVF